MYILNYYFVENKIKIRKYKLNEHNQKWYNGRAQNSQISIKVSELNVIVDDAIVIQFNTFAKD